MKKINIKEHNQKYFEFSKRLVRMDYPSKRIAKGGSIIGVTIGMALIIVGVFGSVRGFIWGTGSLIAGLVTIVSNVFNSKRLK